LWVINDKLGKQLKKNKLANKTRQMRVLQLEQWVMGLGDNLKDEACVQTLIKKGHRDPCIK